MAITEAANAGPPGADGDAALVGTVLGGDTSAYAALYDRYAPLIRALCYDTTGSAADSADLSQEVFLRAFGNLRSLRRPDRYGPWLVGITKIACRDWRRSRARDRHRYIVAGPERAAAPAGPGNDGLEQRLHEALAQLPERERLAVQAFYLLEASAERAQAALNVSRSGLYRILQRARNRLKKLLKDDGEDLP